MRRSPVSHRLQSRTIHDRKHTDRAPHCRNRDRSLRALSHDRRRRITLYRSLSRRRVRIQCGADGARQQPPSRIARSRNGSAKALQVCGSSLLRRHDFMRHYDLHWSGRLVSHICDRCSDCSFVPSRPTTEPHRGSRASASEGIERPLVLAVRSVITPRGPNPPYVAPPHG